MKKSYLLLSLVLCCVLVDSAEAKKRRKRSSGPPTAQDAYDFSFPRFESKCKWGDREFSVQIRGKGANISKDETELGSAYFFIMDGKKIAVSPGVESNLQLKASPTAESSLCESLTAIEYSQGRILFVVQSSTSADSRAWIGILWDTKSNKIIEHKKDLSKVSQLTQDPATMQYLPRKK